MVNVLLIDNYDSFTYNLVQILRESGLCRYHVAYNDSINLEGCGGYDKILISPGPGLPHEAGISCEVIRKWSEHKSILGVCLGHQAIGLVFGARLAKLPFPQHGQAGEVFINQTDSGIFHGLPSHFYAGRYHSWIIDRNGLPSDLLITASGSDGVIMAVRHKHYDVHGVQFHPESVMTAYGRKMIHNWLEGR